MNTINPNKPMISTGFPGDGALHSGGVQSKGGVRDASLTVGGSFSDESVGGVSFDARLLDESLKPDKFDRLIRGALDFPIPDMPKFDRITN